MSDETKETQSPDQKRIAELEGELKEAGSELSEADDQASASRRMYVRVKIALERRQEIDGALIQGLLGERLDLMGRIKRIDLRVAALRKEPMTLARFLDKSIAREVNEALPDDSAISEYQVRFNEKPDEPDASPAE